jgi:hypothetical protein
MPSPLPTVHEIESATETLSKTTGCRVVVVGNFVVKYGAQVDLLEGQTMLFLQSSPVPVPRVYALFRKPDENGTCRSYIVMEHIKGMVLSSQWGSMNATAKKAVTSKLRIIFDSMRKLESPGGYCSVGRGGLPDGLFWTDSSNQYAGPFDTEAAFNAAIVDKYTADAAYKGKANYYARAFGRLFQEHPPVFSHGDFQLKNVMLRQVSSSSKVDTKDIENMEVVLIDWEFAGWYPSYWDYARAIFACGTWEGDWNFWIEEVLDPFWHESAWVGMMLGEMWS